ncbi:phage tail terminator protein [Rhodopseudomonas palustris]|uniref:Uncharacterized protein n=1 Tax=Rhodopseudomonas palustris TaxID=1076 RepID=A0A418V421_RHOPL|nr:hypothetical protein [Rhodopseudomonas palustris]RJF70869.1 hypothetical protein D4Q52_14665 [Rhodopseudomonas palustris]
MTTLIESVADRLDTEVAALHKRIETIADLAALMSEGAMPQRDVAAFVVPLGFDDRGGDAAAGLHTQLIAESVGVILCVKSLGDAKARRAVPAVDGLKDQVIDALVGWAPDHVVGVFRTSRGRLVSVNKGLVIYQIDFVLVDQLRIER